MQNQTSEETQEETQPEPEKSETQEETSEQTSEETVEKETSEETPKTPEPVDYEAKFKASQAEAIRLKKENEGLRKAKPSNPSDSKVNVDEVLEITTATEGLSPAEVSELKLRADATGKSLLESRKDENFVLWQNAHKDKVEKDNSPQPSTKQGQGGAQEKSLKDMSVDEKDKFLSERGFVKPFPKPKPTV